MKKGIFIIIVFLFVSVMFLLAEDTPDIEAEKAEVAEMITKTLPVKQKNLATKTYSGTMSQIMTARITDVNEVHSYIGTIKDKAQVVCEKMGYNLGKTEAMKKLIKQFSGAEKIEKQKNNDEFTKTVIDLLEENPPDPNDPNYVLLVERDNEFLQAVMEICSPI